MSQHNKQSNGETLMEACKTYFAEGLSLLDPVVIRDNLIELCGLAQVSGLYRLPTEGCWPIPWQ